MGQAKRRGTYEERRARAQDATARVNCLRENLARPLPPWRQQPHGNRRLASLVAAALALGRR